MSSLRSLLDLLRRCKINLSHFYFHWFRTDHFFSLTFIFLLWVKQTLQFRFVLNWCNLLRVFLCSEFDLIGRYLDFPCGILKFLFIHLNNLDFVVGGLLIILNVFLQPISVLLFDVLIIHLLIQTS